MDKEKVVKGLEWILDGDRFGFGENWHIDSEPKTEEEQARYCIQRAIELLKEQEEGLPPIDDGEKWFVCGNQGLGCGVVGRKTSHGIERFSNYCAMCGMKVKWE